MSDHPANCRNCELDGDPSFCGADPGNREPYHCDMCDRYELDIATLRAKLAELEQQNHDLRGDLAASELLCADHDRDRLQASAKLAAVREVLNLNGCECEGDYSDPSRVRCLRCQIAEALGDK